MISLTPLRIAAACLAPLMILAPHPAQAASPASAEIRMDHISIVKLGSHGSPVILIPGLATPRAVWDGVAPPLAQDHIVYLVQVNGFAGDAPGANLAPGLLDGIVADLSTFMTAHQLSGTPIVGHSMGGLVALKFAAAHTAQAGPLLVVDGLPYFPATMNPAGPAPELSLVQPAATAMRDAIAKTYGKPVDPVTVERDIAGLASRETSRVKMRAWAAAADRRVAAQGLYEDLTTDARPLLPSIKSDVTLVYPIDASGAPADRVTAFYRRQFEGLASFHMIPISGGAHFIMLDQPELFRAALDAFLKR